MLLTGVVEEGQRLVGAWARDCPEAFAAALGMPIFPGSLNIYVAEDVQLFERDVIPSCDSCRNGALNILPCTVNGVGAFILRHERPAWLDARTGRQPARTMIEVVASERMPDIAYGSTVTLAWSDDARVNSGEG